MIINNNLKRRDFLKIHIIEPEEISYIIKKEKIPYS